MTRRTRFLVEGHPDIAAQWHPELNADLVAQWHPRNHASPDQFGPGSQRKVWWRCPVGHEYQARISNRSRGTGLIDDAATWCSGPRRSAAWYFDEAQDLPPHAVLGGGEAGDERVRWLSRCRCRTRRRPPPRPER
ncbi:zinc-ribbon domain-containing protein, partial [Streptomyces exfoliatus]